MKKALLFMVIAILGAVVIFGACSKSTKPDLTQGSDDDPAYQVAQALAREFVDSLSLFAVDGFSYLGFDGTKALDVLSDSASINYDANTKWWVVYVHHDSTYLDLTARDSVRFEEGDTCTMFPDSLHTTGIDYRASLDLFAGDDTLNISADLGNRLHITGIQSEQVFFNGLTTGDLGRQLGNNNSFHCVYSGSENNVTFNRFDLENGPNPHPVAGNMGLAMMVHTVVPQGSTEINWTIDITFYMDHYHVHFESGNNYWDWDGPYGA
jgi:hypothetical protein